MDGPDLTKEDAAWAAPLNRVAIILNEHGEFDGVFSDSPIEFFVVQPSCKSDRVYKYSAGEVGPNKVQELFAGNAIGHSADGTLGEGDGTGKHPPSKPNLSVIDGGAK